MSIYSKKAYIVAFKSGSLFGLDTYQYPYKGDPEITIAIGVKYSYGYTPEGEFEYLPCCNNMEDVREIVSDLTGRCHCSPTDISILEIEAEQCWANDYECDEFIARRAFSISEVCPAL